ncbi:autophagy-related protein 13-domain-containing protein [Emericellopsis atlantica]|uniref:Autophagy-related protein 13 n=1 Tax=Emericellopsis atlantica TaxID=2614577 RepID=A0A9P7ZG45_9HYPO|nr:autophagy-related protein 13-domain-containing protein [Emericellopsis atlantica]KAG9251306.1 autophagy-related protein 13-domain-containing protein [Emericellopsis atlantica]
MHQQPRAPPRTASPASSPQTNPARTNNPRQADEETSLVTRARTGSNASRGGDSLPSPSPTADHALAMPGPPVESVKKLDQIVQNFFNKVAVLVLDSRIKTKPTRTANGVKKPNKWFQLETDEIDDFRDELKTWKLSGSIDSRPPPLIIEVYLDTSRLESSQSLTIVDEEGKRWDVMEQLSEVSANGTTTRNTQVILERWKVELRATDNPPSDDFGPSLPTIYKKAIVFFRSFFAASRLLPAWRFASQGAARNPHPALIPRCRIRTSDPRSTGIDLLKSPIDGKSDATTDYLFGDLDIPVGRMAVAVTYRNDCSFRIDDSEALLSSRFMGVDENFFKPSLQQHQADRSRNHVAEIGSLRDRRQERGIGNVRQTYGSLSTFHGDAALGTSPLTALKSIRPPGSDTSSPPASFPKHSDIHPPSSLPMASRVPSARPSMRSDDSTGRRPSVSFQPFKAGSLSGSPIPRTTESDTSNSPNSYQKPPSLSQPRSRTSLTAGNPASLRGGPPTPQPAEPAGGSSPRPGSTSRYSSSFTHRRGRLSVGGASRTGDDEQSSSGRQSLASSLAQPGSGLLAEPGASSGSLGAEEDNISEFLKALDSKKTLKSFDSPKRGESATNKTVAQLSKFHMMRESNNALTESMTSSVQMQRSLSSSSRHMTSNPGMVTGSISASSSPSKPHSPHTPHTPAIPSRLSENSLIDDSSTSRRVSSRRPAAPESTVPESSRENTITGEGTTAIDIPLSPRLGSYQRRSSSVAQQSRAVMDDDTSDLPFATNRSISLGADDRDPPTISGLLGRRLDQEAEQQTLQPAADIRTTETSNVLNRQDSNEDNNPPDAFLSGLPNSPYGRKRYMGMGAQRNRQTPPQSSRGSFTGSGSRPGREDAESLSGEPLMFDLSEMDPQGRRSLEADRGGNSRRMW